MCVARRPPRVGLRSRRCGSAMLDSARSDTSTAAETTTPRPSVATSLRLALDQRRSWLASASGNSGQSSPPKADLDVQRQPLRVVVARCLEEWDVGSSDESEDDDDFCGWRVGSRQLPAGDRSGNCNFSTPAAAAAATQGAPASTPGASTTPVGGFGFAVRTPSSGAFGFKPGQRASTPEAVSTSHPAHGRPPGSQPPVVRPNSADGQSHAAQPSSAERPASRSNCKLQ